MFCSNFSDIEPYVAQYKDKSHPFIWKKSTEKINLNLLESNLSPTDGKWELKMNAV